MTESEWLTSDNPEAMLAYLSGKVPDRKLRLFVCGLCRQTPWLMSLTGVREAIEASELWGDGLIHQVDVRGRTEVVTPEDGDVDGGQSYLHFSFALGFPDAYFASFFALTQLDRSPNAVSARWCAQSLRCLIGNPFSRPKVGPSDAPPSWLTVTALSFLKLFAANPMRPQKDKPGVEYILPVIAPDPDWLTSDVLALARQMYESREFSAMPILADALQDAGCYNDDILNHCRSDGPHVRGCWVVDLVLDKH